MAELNEKISDEPIVPLFDAAGVNTDDEHNPLIPPSIILPTATEVPPSVSLAGFKMKYEIRTAKERLDSIAASLY